MENWKPVDGFVGVYEISSHGRVRGLSRLTTTANGNKHFVRGRELRPAIVGGYKRLMLRHNGAKRQTHVHTLVAEAFLGPRPAGYVVDHVNGDRRDNHARNLRYVPPSANIVVQLGEDNSQSKLTMRQVTRIMEGLIAGKRLRAIAAEEGVTSANIRSIAVGKTWRHHPLSAATVAAYGDREAMPESTLMAICAKLRDRTASIASIAESVGVPASTVYNINRGRVYVNRRPVRDFLSASS